MKRVDDKNFAPSMSANKVEDVLLEGESVLWRSRPDRRAYIFAACFKMLPIAILWLAVDITLIVFLVLFANVPRKFAAILVPFFAVHLTPVWMWIYNTVKAAIEVKNIEYVFTDRRMIVRKGVIGIDFDYVFYDKIEAINVKVALTDKMFKVGDIYITAVAKAAVLFDQRDPYALSAKLQQIASDMKADINYPNALRPDVNSGYNTEYSAFLKEKDPDESDSGDDQKEKDGKTKRKPSE